MYTKIIEKELAEHGSFAACAIGNSMRPMLRDGEDMVILEPLQKEAEKYDIVLYPNSRGDYTLHRVIAVRDGEYITRGDNTYFREYVPKEDVIAILVAYNKGGKRHNVGDLGCRLYSRFWNLIYPIRHAVRFLRLLPGRVIRRLFKQKNS